MIVVDKFVIDAILNNFDFTFMLVVNVLTYMSIKIIEDCISPKRVAKEIKRALLITNIFFVGLVYFAIGYENKIILLNSAILAPISWSWVFKPILKKFNLDYIKNYEGYSE